MSTLTTQLEEIKTKMYKLEEVKDYLTPAVKGKAMTLVQSLDAVGKLDPVVVEQSPDVFRATIASFTAKIPELDDFYNKGIARKTAQEEKEEEKARQAEAKANQATDFVLAQFGLEREEILQAYVENSIGHFIFKDGSARSFPLRGTIESSGCREIERATMVETGKRILKTVNIPVMEDPITYGHGRYFHIDDKDFALNMQGEPLSITREKKHPTKVDYNVIMPFLECVKTLVPDDFDRDIALSQIACCFQAGNRHLSRVILVVKGPKGTGKSTLFSEIPTLCLGTEFVYVDNKNKNDVMENKGRSLLVVHDDSPLLADKGKFREKVDFAKNETKDVVRVREMRKDSTTVERFFSSIVLTNSFTLRELDRRWAIIDTDEKISSSDSNYDDYYGYIAFLKDVLDRRNSVKSLEFVRHLTAFFMTYDIRIEVKSQRFYNPTRELNRTSINAVMGQFFRNKQNKITQLLDTAISGDLFTLNRYFLSNREVKNKPVADGITLGQATYNYLPQFLKKTLCLKIRANDRPLIKYYYFMDKQIGSTLQPYTEIAIQLDESVDRDELLRCISSDNANEYLSFPWDIVNKEFTDTPEFSEYKTNRISIDGLEALDILDVKKAFEEKQPKEDI